LFVAGPEDRRLGHAHSQTEPRSEDERGGVFALGGQVGFKCAPCPGRVLYRLLGSVALFDAGKHRARLFERRLRRGGFRKRYAPGCGYDGG
jgi:hypothetical protein